MGWGEFATVLRKLGWPAGGCDRLLQIGMVAEVLLDFLNRFFDGEPVRLEMYFRVERRLVGGINAGEFQTLATRQGGASLFIKTLGIARLADFQRRVDEDFDEFARWHQCPDRVAVGSEG